MPWALGRDRSPGRPGENRGGVRRGGLGKALRRRLAWATSRPWLSHATAHSPPLPPPPPNPALSL